MVARRVTALASLLAVVGLSACGSRWTEGMSVAATQEEAVRLPLAWTPTQATSQTAVPSSTAPQSEEEATEGMAPATGPVATAAPTLGEGQEIRLSSLRMTDALVGWGVEVSGRLVRTIDGGRSWREVGPAGVAIWASTVSVPDAWNAWVVQPTLARCGVESLQSCPGFTLWRSSDAGARWRGVGPFPVEGTEFTPINVQFDPDGVGRLLFVSARDGNAVRSGLMVTENGGETWQLAPNPFEWPCMPTNIVFTDEKTGWMGGNCPETTSGYTYEGLVAGEAGPDLAVTTDGGRSWRSIGYLPVTVDNPLAFEPPVSTGFMCGVNSLTHVGGGSLLVEWTCTAYPPGRWNRAITTHLLTTDEGKTWRSWPVTGNETFVNAEIGWRISPEVWPSKSQALEATTDGGRSWHRVRKVEWPIADLEFIDPEHGWALVTNDPSWNRIDAFMLVCTTDGGRTWQDLKPYALSPAGIETVGPLPASPPADLGSEATATH